MVDFKASLLGGLIWFKGERGQEGDAGSPLPICLLEKTFAKTHSFELKGAALVQPVKGPPGPR